MKNPYLELLKKISNERPSIYIFGGWSEEALLHGKTTRKHEDVDIFLEREDTNKYVKKFMELGFKDYEIYLQDPNGNPTVLHSENDGLAIELCIFDKDKEGRLYFDIYGETEEEKFRVFVSKDVYDYPKSNVDGVEIQTVSPLAQYQLRAGLNITKSFGEFRPKDVKSQKALKDKFFKDKKEEDLQPKVEKL